jgi:hypothetical protein
MSKYKSGHNLTLITFKKMNGNTIEYRKLQVIVAIAKPIRPKIGESKIFKTIFTTKQMLALAITRFDLPCEIRTKPVIAPISEKAGNKNNT